MGRKQKYNTEEEKHLAQKESQMRHYWKNVERLKKEALKRYYDKKKKLL